MLQLISNPVGVWGLSKREIHRFIAVAGQSIFPPLMSSILFMYIFGIAIGSHLDIEVTHLSYFEFLVPGLMTLHLVSNSYENTSGSLFIARWHNHIQEILLCPLSYIEMVIGLLAGGVVRGLIVFFGVYGISFLFEPLFIIHPWLLLYFAVSISVIFSCAGMIAALWAEDFGMLSVWSIYFIMPLVILGGVFHPTQLLPDIIQKISLFNPMHYLVNGIRYSITDFSDSSVFISALVSFVLMVGIFWWTVFLFKIGYKLRT